MKSNARGRPSITGQPTAFARADIAHSDLARAGTEDGQSSLRGDRPATYRQSASSTVPRRQPPIRLSIMMAIGSRTSGARRPAAATQRNFAQRQFARADQAARGRFADRKYRQVIACGNSLPHLRSDLELVLYMSMRNPQRGNYVFSTAVHSRNLVPKAKAKMHLLTRFAHDRFGRANPTARLSGPAIWVNGRSPAPAGSSGRARGPEHRHF